MTVLHLPKRKVLRPPTATAVHAPPLLDEPSMETTVMEAVAVRKWLHFALQDVHFQLGEMAKDKTVSRRSFNESKQTAGIISAYLIGVLQDLEARLGQSIPANDEPVVE